jgi:hypothetical protein
MALARSYARRNERPARALGLAHHDGADGEGMADSQLAAFVFLVLLAVLLMGAMDAWAGDE